MENDEDSFSSCSVDSSYKVKFRNSNASQNLQELEQISKNKKISFISLNKS
jgi:hypothetical protein